jgi:chemotaxis signal transduction protein
MTPQTNENLICLLLPIFGKTILLPAAAIVEIIHYKKTEIEALPDVPSWFAGMLNWRGIQIPATSLEQMEAYLSWNGIVKQQSELENPCYIAVVNRITKINSNIEMQQFRQYPFFSIILQGAPKLFRIFGQSLEVCNQSEMIDARFIMEVKVGENTAFVPNLNNAWNIIDTLPSRLQWRGKIVRRNGG